MPSRSVGRIAKGMLWFSALFTTLFGALIVISVLPLLQEWQASGHMDWTSYWHAVNEQGNWSIVAVIALTALPVQQQSALFNTLREMARRGAEDVFPLAERQPDPVQAGDLPGEGVELGPFVRWQASRRATYGCMVWVLLAMAAVLFASIVAVVLLFPAAFGIWFGRLAIRSLAGLREPGIGPRITVGYDGLSWRSVPGTLPAQALSWDRVRAFWQVHGDRSPIAGLQTVFFVDGDKTSMQWRISSIHSTQERIVHARTGLPLRDCSEAAAAIRVARKGRRSQRRDLPDSQQGALSSESAHALVHPRVPVWARIAAGYSIGIWLLITVATEPGAWLAQHFLAR
jgi:hypothetical protein